VQIHKVYKNFNNCVKRHVAGNREYHSATFVIDTIVFSSALLSRLALISLLHTSFRAGDRPRCHRNKSGKFGFAPDCRRCIIQMALSIGLSSFRHHGVFTFNQFPQIHYWRWKVCGFCMTTIKEENRGLTFINHWHRLRNPLFTQKKFWCTKVKASN